MVKYTQAIRRQIADELFECVWPFCGIGAERVKNLLERVDLVYQEAVTGGVL